MKRKQGPGRVTNIIKNYTAHQDEESYSGKHLTNIFGKEVLRKLQGPLDYVILTKVKVYHFQRGLLSMDTWLNQLLEME